MRILVTSVSMYATILLCSSSWAQTTTINFNKDKLGAPPKHFSMARTGKGKPGIWKVLKKTATAKKERVLAQLHSDRTNYRFPVCVYQKFSAKNVDISVKFKPISGKVDQAAGLVWRYRNKNNYYVVRANALEDNVVMYKVHRGRRSDLPLLGKGRTYGMKAKVPSRRWSTLRVTAKGNLFTVYLNGKKLYQVVDKTFSKAGKIGVWTKADSVTHFDDLQFRALP